jgi:acyl-CoA thioesterase I
MANALIYHVYSGQAFFSGAALALLALLGGLLEKRGLLAALRMIGACTGVILIVVSATPLPIWSYLTAGAITLLWIALDVMTRTSHHRWRMYVRWAMAAVLVLGVSLEAPYHFAPRLTASGNPPVFIIGDSLTAGVGGPIETWPVVLARQHTVVIHDLSVAGADATTAMRQAERINRPGSLVIVEIGGNDIIRENSPAVFERGLDALLTRIRQGNHTIVMFELPLPPFCNRYGEAQRRLARRHGAFLIPKRVLLGVLTTEGATLDTIHLSARGHQLMAQVIWHVVKSAFERGGGDSFA